ncbi:MAG: DUF411 domain-containing protein [Aquincola sp.]|nr:DUF411 domain-containing protein [Aquincola sp.]MDH4290461.1 DUF411 domain-containing protein [Aquincola sp.]MDH5331249.1 DUF411 domain-containing protein [Aquincola sp.]
MKAFQTSGSETTAVSRRTMLWVAAATALALPRGARAAPTQLPLVEVWKSPTCGCCGDWMKHLEANGFTTKVHLINDTAIIRRGLHLNDKYGSCHTALVGGYAVEGHVPAREIKRLLKEKPQAVVGIAVPGMPIGAPGMDTPQYNGRKVPYDVVLVRRDGTSSVYQSYR